MTIFFIGFLAGCVFLAAYEAYVVLATIAFFERMDRRIEEEEKTD